MNASKQNIKLNRFNCNATILLEFKDPRFPFQ